MELKLELQLSQQLGKVLGYQFQLFVHKELGCQLELILLQDKVIQLGYHIQLKLQQVLVYRLGQLFHIQQVLEHQHIMEQGFRLL